MRFKTETSVGLFILVAIIIFLYMTFQIGVLRFDTSRYNRYTVYFHDIAGLSKKADVQIAGVKVGWVDEVELVNNGDQVKTSIMVLKTYTIFANAYGIIRQDGLLGSKYLEIIPGDSILPRIKAGGILMQPSKDPVSIDNILSEFQVIARNLSDVTNTLKATFGGDLGQQRLETAIEGFNEATKNIANFSKTLDETIPGLSDDIRDGVTRASLAIEAAAQPISDVVNKINEGEGALGRLIGDEEVGYDLKYAVEGLKYYFETIDRLAIIFDAHSESMYGLGNEMNFKDARGYFNVRIHPTEDYFYLVGVVGSYMGKILRHDEHRQWFANECGDILIPEEMNLTDWQKIWLAPRRMEENRIYDSYLWNLQFGKIYDDLAFRFGLMEGTFGIGVDVDIPFDNDEFRWVMTLEAFDFYGRNRLNDHRLHLKWLNRVFFTKSLYVDFGADDFISKTNANAFFGAGLRFADDEVKYYASGLKIPSGL